MASLEYHGHACFVLESTRGRIIIDPFLTGNPKADVAPENVGQVDAVLVSHGHGDHFGDTLAIAKQHRATASRYEIASILKGWRSHTAWQPEAGTSFLGWIKLVPARTAALRGRPRVQRNGRILHSRRDRLVYHMGIRSDPTCA